MSCCPTNNNESILILNKTREAAVCAQTNCASAAESAEAAATSAYAASVSAQQAAASASTAVTKANEAAASAATATTKASEAAISATNAANSASSALTSKNAAATSATNASSSASAASTSATNAANSATAAQTAKTQTESLFDQFGDQYLGAKSSDPLVDNDGDPLNSGDIYWNTTSNTLRFYNGTVWVAPETIATTAATNAQNSATTAQNAATTATTKAGEAATSATNAANSATQTNTLYNSFNAMYLGAKATSPTLDNEGNPLQEGALYFNSVSKEMFVWQGGSWIIFGFDEFTPFLATGTTARDLVTRMADVVNVKDFGAVGDGVTDDTTAMRDFANYFNNARQSSPVHGIIPAGNYILTDYISFAPSPTPPYRATLNWDGARFICDYNTDPNNVDWFFRFGDPNNPLVGPGGIDVEGRAIFTQGPNCTNAPIAIYQRCSESSINSVMTGQWNNTIIDIHNAQNIQYEDWICYNAGFAFEYADAGDSLYRQTGTILSRVSGSFVFPTDCVGKHLQIRYSAASIVRKNKIIARISDTQVELDSNITDGQDRDIKFGSPAPRTTAGSPVVTLDGPVTTNMVGKYVGIPRAGDNNSILWASIISVNTSTKTITLNKNANFTLNPVSNPLTETTEISTPAIFVRSDLTIDGGLFSNKISQCRFLNLQLEQYAGVGIGVNKAEFVSFNQAKLHGITIQTGSSYSLAHIWGNQCSGSYEGEFDVRTLGIYKMIFSNQTSAFYFPWLISRVSQDEKILRVDPYNPGWQGGKIVFGLLSIGGARSTSTFNDLVDDQNPSSQPGYIAPVRFLMSDYPNAKNYLWNNMYADESGNLVFTNIPTSPSGLPSGSIWSDLGTLKIV